MKVNYLTVTLRESVKAIIDYNNGTYRGRPNLVVDKEGYELFKNGLGKTNEAIEVQVRWIGENYGGTGNVLAGQVIASKIAGQIYAIRDDYEAHLMSFSFPTDFQSDPTAKVHYPQISWLYRPFQQTFVSPEAHRKSCNWMTWATKFWHFLEPDTFPIMDSHARRFFNISSSVDLVDQYIRLLERMNEILGAKKEWLPLLRKEDKGSSPSDIKLWDKIAFELGRKSITSRK